MIDLSFIKLHQHLPQEKIDKELTAIEISNKNTYIATISKLIHYENEKLSHFIQISKQKIKNLLFFSGFLCVFYADGTFAVFTESLDKIDTVLSGKKFIGMCKNAEKLILMKRKSVLVVSFFHNKFKVEKEVFLNIELVLLKSLPVYLDGKLFFINQNGQKEAEFCCVDLEENNGIAVVSGLFKFDFINQSGLLILGRNCLNFSNNLAGKFTTLSSSFHQPTINVPSFPDSSLSEVITLISDKSSLGIIINTKTLLPSTHTNSTFDIPFQINHIYSQFPFILFSSGTKLMLYNYINMKSIFSFDLCDVLDFNATAVRIEITSESFVIICNNNFYFVEFISVFEYVLSHLNLESSFDLMSNFDFTFEIYKEVSEKGLNDFKFLEKLVEYYLKKGLFFVFSLNEGLSFSNTPVTPISPVSPSLLTHTSSPVYCSLFVEFVKLLNLNPENLQEIINNLLNLFDTKSEAEVVLLLIINYAQTMFDANYVILVLYTLLRLNKKNEISDFVNILTTKMTITEIKGFNDVLVFLEEKGFFDDLIKVYKVKLTILTKEKSSETEVKKIIEKIITLLQNQNHEGELQYFLLNYNSLIPYDLKLEICKKDEFLSFYLFGTAFNRKVFNDCLSISVVCSVCYLFCFREKFKGFVLSYGEDKKELNEKDVEMKDVVAYFDACVVCFCRFDDENFNVLDEFKKRENKDLTFVKYLQSLLKKNETTNKTNKRFQYFLKFRLFFLGFLERVLKFLPFEKLKLESLFTSNSLILEQILVEETKGNHLVCIKKLIEIDDFSYAEEYAIKNNKVLLLLQLFMAQKKSFAKVTHLLNNNIFNNDDVLLILNSIPEDWNSDDVYPFLRNALITSSMVMYNEKIVNGAVNKENFDKMLRRRTFEKEYIYFNKGLSERRIKCAKCGYEVDVKGGFCCLPNGKLVYHPTCYETTNK